MNRLKYRVYQNARFVARFDLASTAFWFASVYGKRIAPSDTFEVSDKTGLIGQFVDGYPTPEFQHISIPGDDAGDRSCFTFS